MINQTKMFAVEDLVGKLKTAKSAALIDYQGLDAEQTAELRKKIKKAGGFMEVIKNTLISRSLAKLGIALDSPLEGPTAVVLANEDEIAPIKAVAEVAKEFKKPEFKFGVYEGKKLALEDLKRFVDLPPKEVLLSQIVGCLANPFSRMIGSLKSNQTKLVLVIKEISKSKEN